MRERRTLKAGVTGKFGTRYGAKLRKQVKKIEVIQRQRYVCTFCGRTAVRRIATGIWRCTGCRRSIAGGAWELTTAAATTAKTTINRLKKEAVDVGAEELENQKKEVEKKEDKEEKKDKKEKKEKKEKKDKKDEKPKKK